MPDHFTDENEGEPVAWRSRRRGSDDDWDLFFTKPAPRSDYEDQPLYARPDPAVERLQRELEEARGIVRNIHWMACRYADGRNTYAPHMYNRAIAKAYEAGWLTFDPAGRRYDVQYARDGMSPEWKTVEERALAAEASLVKAREALKQIAKQDDVELALDPSWAKRIATAAIGDQPT